MGSSPALTRLPSPAFLAAFRARADASGRMTFEQFMALALYDPEVGYYRRARPRVGYGAGTDFFTASSSGPLFGELVAASAAELLRQRGQTPGGFTFVEVGAEASGGILGGVEHPFASARTLRLGEPLHLAGPCVVFSNELFDAQPCARYVKTAAGWAEDHVALEGDHLREISLLLDSPPAFLPPDAPTGYRIDAPRGAGVLATQLAAQPWHGVFLAFDYGKSWAELVSDIPQGTARAYFRHTQSNDLLAQPGDQDLTCHVCWDWLSEALQQQGFEVASIVAQEAFFVGHAGAVLQDLLAREASQLTRRKLGVMQLLHPAHLGRKFQVLRAWRREEDSPCTH